MQAQYVQFGCGMCLPDNGATSATPSFSTSKTKATGATRSALSAVVLTHLYILRKLAIICLPWTVNTLSG